MHRRWRRAASGLVVPAGATDPNFSNVVALLHGNGTNNSTTIVDSCGNPLTYTCAGNAKISTAQSKFGGSSIAFDGTGDYLSTPDNVAFDFGTSPFTIECWAYFNSLANNPFLFHQIDSSSSDTAGWFLEAGSNTIYFGHGVQTVAAYNAFAVTLTTGAWNYIKVTRSGTTLTCVVNDTSATPATKTNAGLSYNKTTPVIIGGGGPTFYAANGLNGYIQDFRITKGVARSNTTAPTAAFPNS